MSGTSVAVQPVIRWDEYSDDDSESMENASDLAGEVQVFLEEESPSDGNQFDDKVDDENGGSNIGPKECSDEGLIEEEEMDYYEDKC